MSKLNKTSNARQKINSANGHSSKIKNWFVNISLIAASTFFAAAVFVGVGEVWIRSQELPEDTGSIYEIREEALPRAVLKPGVEEIAHGSKVRVNSLGFRGKDYSLEKPKNTKRIVLLGDSFAFGAGAAEEVILPTQLENMLDQKYADTHIQVLNLGVSDYNTDDQLALFQEKGIALEPDLVVLLYVMNDIEIKSEYLDDSKNNKKQPSESKKQSNGNTRQYRNPLYGIVNTLRSQSHFLAYLAPRVASLGRTLGFDLPSSGSFYSEAFANDVEGWKRSKNALREIHSICKKNEIRFALVLFPLMTNFNDSYPAKKSHEIIQEFAQNENIPFLDLLPHYMGKNARTLWVSPTDGHPNEEGHRIAAEAFTRFLQENSELFP